MGMDEYPKDCPVCGKYLVNGDAYFIHLDNCKPRQKVSVKC